MNIFNPNKSLYHKIIIISTIIILILSSATFIIDRFFKGNILFNYDKRPNLVVEEIPKVVTMFSFDIPNIPFGFERVESTERFIDTTNQQSVIFNVNTEHPKIYSKFKPLTKINVDSILNSSKSMTVVDALLLLTLEFKLKNQGDKQAEIVLLSLSDTNVFEDVIRTAVLKDNDFIEKSVRPNTLENDVIFVLKDSVFKYTTSKYIPVDFDENENFTIHFYCIYRDSKLNYYDFYYWVKYHFKGFNFTMYPQPIYILKGNGNYELDQIIFHYRPKKPTVNDLVGLVEKRFEYERELTDIEKKTVLTLFEKVKNK